MALGATSSTSVLDRASPNPSDRAKLDVFQRQDYAADTMSVYLKATPLSDFNHERVLVWDAVNVEMIVPVDAWELH